MKTPIQRIKSCRYCTDYKGDPKPILPQDLQYAIRMPSGDYKCLTCQEEEIQDRIVKVTPNSQRAREIIAEDKHEVDKHNQGADKLNRSARVQLMKRRSYKY